VNTETRDILSFVAGEETLVKCPTEKSYHQELADMAVFYGPPRPAYALYSAEGDWEYHYSERPK